MINRIRAFAVAAALATLPVIASAQDKQFEVGTKLLNVGVLFGDGGYAGYGSSVGVGGGFEVGIKNIADQVNLGVGGSIGYTRSSFGSSNRTVTSVVAFVNGHYQIKSVPKLDLYAGPVLGFADVGYKFDGTDFCNSSVFDYGCGSGFAGGVQAGARWALTPKVLGWAQLSPATNLPLLSAGITFKF